MDLFFILSLWLSLPNMDRLNEYSEGEFKAWIEEVDQIHPIEAAIIAAQYTKIGDLVVDERGRSMGTEWLLATGQVGSGLKDLRGSKYTIPGTTVHKLDRNAASRVYSWGKKKRMDDGRFLINPKKCKYHKNFRDWSTRGSYEMMAAYQLRYTHALLDGCFDPKWFDVPLFTAITASLHMKNYCERQKGGRCTYMQARCLWAGAGKCTRELGEVKKRFQSARRRVKEKLRNRLLEGRLTVEELQRDAALSYNPAKLVPKGFVPPQRDYILFPLTPAGVTPVPLDRRDFPPVKRSKISWHD